MISKIQLLFARVMLIADSDIPGINLSYADKIKYVFFVLAHLAPVAFFMDWIHAWFRDNGQFFFFVCVALIINMVVGIWFHLKYGTFKMRDFLLKNVEMMGVVIIVYVILEMLRYTAGENIAGELFRIIIQVLTLLYPTSKVLRNMFIISKGKHPPKFIMLKLYNFERYGDLEEFFKTKKGEDADDPEADKHLEEIIKRYEENKKPGDEAS